LAALRNRFGSGDCRFRFHFVAGAAAGVEPSFKADAPLLAHRVKPKMIPSTAKGKKAFTSFRRLAESGGTSPGSAGCWTLWEAECDFFRVHQVRAHAATHGIPVLGDALYEGPEVPTVQDLEPRRRRSGPNSVAFDGVALHLSGVDLDPKSGGEVVRSELPRQFSLLLKRMGLPEPS
jgi:23S rRNA-/tRNA-specific pseudouridylate synthase